MLLGKCLAHRHRSVLRAQPVVRLAHTPQIGLGVEVAQIGEGARWPEVLAHVANGTLHAALLVTPGHGHRARLEVVVAGKRQQLGREADGIALALQYGTLEVVVQQHPGQTTPALKGLAVGAQKALHARVQREAQEDAPRPRQHHDKGHQGTFGAPDLQVTKVRPVDLALLAHQRDQAQIGLGARAGPVVGNEVSEVVGPALVAPLAGHGVQAARPQGGELLQCLVDEGQIRVDARRAHHPDAGQAGLAQDALDAAVVHLELARNGARAPSLDMVVTQDLGMKFRAHGHDGVLQGWPNVGGDGCEHAQTRFAQTHHRRGDRNGTVLAPVVHAMGVASHQGAVKQAVLPVGNPDASLCLRVEPGNGADARRGHDARACSTGSESMPPWRNGYEPAKRRGHRSSAGRDRSGCR